MLNEPEGQGGQAGGQGQPAGGAPGSDSSSYIQVTPEEKEAIDRVSYNNQLLTGAY